MKISQSDFPLLSWSILAICSSTLISAAIFYFSVDYTERTQRDLSNARNVDNDARRRLAATHQDRENLSTYGEEYAALVKRNIVGDDRRLDWMEGMEELRQMNLVTNFRYYISPQKNYAPQPPFSSGNFDIHYSEMKLEFDLLHEGQLVDFFNVLRNKFTDWYQLEGCTIQRVTTGKETDDKSTATLLKAECDGGWITLKNRNDQS
ncbi:MAG: hypothetical protein WAW75_07150 [Gallionella sp.]